VPYSNNLCVVSFVLELEYKDDESLNKCEDVGNNDLKVIDQDSVD
jgi:hypothetical protein